jgi:hypothetical protein
MAENLLKILPDLTEKERNEIVYAVNVFGPPRYRIHPLRYYDPASVGLLQREDVIGALHKVYSHYGTASALDLACKLIGEPPQSGEG